MESKDKKASKLSYSEWFSFYMVILHNNIPLAHAYAKRAYSSQLEEVENDDIDIELENYKDIDSNISKLGGQMWTPETAHAKVV